MCLFLALFRTKAEERSEPHFGGDCEFGFGFEVRLCCDFRIVYEVPLYTFYSFFPSATSEVAGALLSIQFLEAGDRRENYLEYMGEVEKNYCSKI